VQKSGMRDRNSWGARAGCSAVRLGIACWIGFAWLELAVSLGASPGRHLRHPDSWYAAPEGRRILENILSHQSELGGWPKNVDTTAARYAGDPRQIKPTFDNGATTDELRFLARLHRAAPNESARRAFERGFDYILQAQYPTGGWPQSFPPGRGYPRHITFNDGAMVRLLQFLREAATRPEYGFLDKSRRGAAQQAFDRGIDCILQCQISIDGRRTAWCAQHDETDYRPRPARIYELASISGAESVGIVQLLLTLENPSAEVVRAVDAAVAFFESAKLTGIRERIEPDSRSPSGRNKVIVSDPSAPPLWARFYEIPTLRPLFVDRDGVPRYQLADIGFERRNGYSWYGTWPEKLLSQQYPAWKAASRGR